MLEFLKVSRLKLERRQTDLGALQTELIHLAN